MGLLTAEEWKLTTARGEGLLQPEERNRTSVTSGAVKGSQLLAEQGGGLAAAAAE